MGVKAKCVISFYTFGIIHHVYTYYYSQFEVDFMKSNNKNIQDIKRFNMRYLTSWNMTLQTLYLMLALVFELFLLNKQKISVKTLENFSKFRGYIFTTLVFPSTMVVAFFFWLFYHLNTEYVLPNGIDDIMPGWVNHSIHTNIIFLPLIEFTLQKMWVPSLKTALTGLTLYSHVYNSFYLFTYFETGKWLYPLYELIDWPQRIALMEFMYVIGAATCVLGVVIQNMKSKHCDITKAKESCQERVLNVTKKLL